MDVFEAMRTRRSVRKFKADPVPEEDIRKIIDFATQAPSASNRQMWKFYAVSNRQLLDEMRDAILRKLDSFMELPESEDMRGRLQAARGYSTFFTDAPVSILVFREPYASAVDQLLLKRGATREDMDLLRQRPDIQSIGAAIENLLLAAHAMGYGACWMSAPCLAGQEICGLVDITTPWELVAVIPLGIPDESPSARPRKPVEEVLEFIK